MHNGTTTITNPRTDLDAWQQAIGDLDAALSDATAARLAIDAETVTLDRLEAGAALAVEGKNKVERKARLTLMLADDARYEQHRQALTTARQTLLDAERRIQVTRERCRLLRAALALVAGAA